LLNSLRKNAKGICLMLLCAICLCMGQLLLKFAADDFNLVYAFAGLAICGLGAVMMVLAYRHGDLTVLQPINSTSLIFALFAAAIVLHEPIGVVQIIGVCSIIAGVFLIGGSDNK